MALKHPCFDGTFAQCTGRGCVEDPINKEALLCCWISSGKDIFSDEDDEAQCQSCIVDTETGDFGYCGEVFFTEQLPNVTEEVASPPPPGPGRPFGSIPEGGEVLPELQQTPPSPPQPGETEPTELTPEVDCNENLDDPLCETATIPEAVEQPEEQESSSEDGDGSSGDGGNENNDNSE